MSGFLIDERGRRYEITSVHPFLIGQEARCDLLIPDNFGVWSTRNITANGSHFSLRDFNSSNGTFVNGCRIGTELVLLSDGDSIRFGGVHFSFQSEAKPQSPAYRTKCGSAVDAGSSRGLGVRRSEKSIARISPTAARLSIDANSTSRAVASISTPQLPITSSRCCLFP